MKKERCKYATIYETNDSNGTHRYHRQHHPELTDTIDSIIQNNQDVVGNVEDLVICLEECIGTRLAENDFSKFSYENILTKANSDPTHPVYDILGVNTIGQTMCLGLLIGQDYGMPFYAVLYLDNKGRLRGYIPTTGNAINPITKLPFGEDMDNDDKIAQFLGYTSYGDMDQLLPSVQAQFYDIDKLKTDITSRIQLHP